MNELMPLTVLSSIEQPGFKIPLKDGSIYTLTNEMLEAYRVAYPNTDVDAEMRALVVWNMSNASKRKTKGGILRHINGWLSKPSKHLKQPHGTTQKEYAASTTIQERVTDLSWADGL